MFPKHLVFIEQPQSVTYNGFWRTSIVQSVCILYLRQGCDELGVYFGTQSATRQRDTQYRMPAHGRARTGTQPPTAGHSAARPRKPAQAWQDSQSRANAHKNNRRYLIKDMDGDKRGEEAGDVEEIERTRVSMNSGGFSFLLLSQDPQGMCNIWAP